MNPEKTFSPAVVTSDAATQDYAKIQATHADILNGMTAQSARVNVYNQQKQLERQNKEVVDASAARERETLQSEQQKDQMAFQQKSQELEIKRQALSMK